MLDLTELTAQLNAQLEDLSKRRIEIQKELEAVQLIQRAEQRPDSIELDESNGIPQAEQAQASSTPEVIQPEAIPTPTSPEPAPTAPVEEAPLETEAAGPEKASEETSVEAEPTPPQEVPAATEVQPDEAVPQVPAPIESETAQSDPAPLEAEAPPVEVAEPEQVAQPDPAPLPAEAPPVEVAESEQVAQPEIAAVEEAAPPAVTSPESTAEVQDRRHQLEETVMALELNDEIAVLELMRMFHRPLSPGKIAEELVAVHWNFQGQHPRAAVNAALQKMAQAGKVTHGTEGDYSLPEKTG
ncbi:MAG: hypothetical protein V3R94_04830 [Acidobacteriota bacterium]